VVAPISSSFLRWFITAQKGTDSLTVAVQFHTTYTRATCSFTA
jgi:hypothetical protein